MVCCIDYITDNKKELLLKIDDAYIINEVYTQINYWKYLQARLKSVYQIIYQ